MQPVKLYGDEVRTGEGGRSYSTQVKGKKFVQISIRRDERKDEDLGMSEDNMKTTPAIKEDHCGLDTPG